MTMQTSMPDTAVIAGQLARVPGVRLAMLFGSTVSGRANPDSDIDVAVWLETNAAEGLW